MLGWACERASGTRMADLISALIWQPIGAERDAEITCDPLGSAIHDGGISATARDLARFGQMLVDDGMTQGHPVVPEAWLAGTRAPEPDVREAFAVTDHEFALPGGWYRNQFWVLPGLTVRCWSASASTVSSSMPTAPRVPWWSSCRPGPRRRTRRTCWTRCARVPP